MNTYLVHGDNTMSYPEPPDHTGKAPEHKASALKSSLSSTLRTPMSVEKPIKYKKEYREALKRLNELKGLNIPESEIGNLYNWKQVSTIPTLEESKNLTAIYINILNKVKKEFELNFNLKALHILNERTSRSIPDEYINNVIHGYTFPGAKSHNELIEVSNLLIDIKNELRKPKQKPIPPGFKVCGRCGGSGKYSFNQRDLDRCYGCGGSGVVPIKK